MTSFDVLIAVGDLPRGSAMLLRVLKEPEGMHRHVWDCKPGIRRGESPTEASYNPGCGKQDAREFLEEQFSASDNEDLTKAHGLPKEPGVYRCMLRWWIGDEDNGYETFVEDAQLIDLLLPPMEAARR